MESLPDSLRAAASASAAASVLEAGPNRSGARSRTSTKTDATVASVAASAPNSSASRPTSAFTPTTDSVAPPASASGAPGMPSDEELGGVNRNASLFQRALDVRPFDDPRRLYRLPVRIEHDHDFRHEPH